MFVPGHKEHLLIKAGQSEADMLLLDVEDSVQPTSNKQVARDLVLKHLKLGTFGDKKLFVRVNDRESGHLLKDLDSFCIEGIHGIMYPKSNMADDIYFIDRLLETIEFEKTFDIGKFLLIPLIETASAVLHADSICKSSKRVIAIAYGSEDFIRDLQGIHDKESMSLFVPRAMIAMAARANGVIPIDTVHIKVHDLDDLEKNIKLARNFGFEGMLVLNPKELPLVHKYFSPSEAEYKEAKEMVAAFEEIQRKGEGVAIINNKFVGPPLVENAKKVIEKYELIIKNDD